MDPEKLRKLLLNIRNFKYPRTVLQEVDGFEELLARDLETDTKEAMALLGFLLARDFVRIIPDMGLVVNPDSAGAQALIKSGPVGKWRAE